MENTVKAILEVMEIGSDTIINGVSVFRINRHQYSIFGRTWRMEAAIKLILQEKHEELVSHGRGWSLTGNVPR